MNGDIASMKFGGEPDQMISILELRRILDTAFLPMRCTSKVGDGNNLVLQRTNHITHHMELTVTGIDALTLNSSREIAKLVAEIKEEAGLRAGLPDKLSSRS